MRKEEIAEILAGIVESDDPVDINRTAKELESKTFSPSFLKAVPGFLYFTLTELRNEIEETLSREPRDESEKQVDLLVYYYQILVSLRRNELSAWDMINELYEDD